MRESQINFAHACHRRISGRRRHRRRGRVPHEAARAAEPEDGGPGGGHVGVLGGAEDVQVREGATGGRVLREVLEKSKEVLN